MPAVERILQRVPKASWDTFRRFFLFKEYLQEVAFSKQQVIKSYIATGNVLLDGLSNNLPDFVKMLNNCPTIARYIEQGGDAVALISKCREIATEMLASKQANPSTFVGTPSDERMEQAFSEFFGPCHVGNKDVTSGKQVTDLEFIRWRTAVYGASWMEEGLNAPPRTTTATRTATTSTATTTAPASHTSQTSASSASSSSTTTTSQEGANEIGSSSSEVAKAKAKRRGKSCSNPNCPDNSEYIAAFCKNTWTKCPSNCHRCGFRNKPGGSTHVCGNAVCKQVLAEHVAVVAV